MDSLPRRPSLSLKTIAFAARWSVWLLLAAWLVFACAWGALQWFIVPRIDELRPQLEARASQVLGISVRIGAITTHPQGVFPSFEFSDIRLFDPDGREVLHLPKVVATLSPASVWNLGFEQLYIDRPQLNVRRTAQGRILVAGLDLSKGQDAEGSASDWLFSQTELVIRDGSLLWTDELRAQPPLELQQVDLVIRNQYRRHALRLDVTPPTELGGRFYVIGDFRQPLLSSHAGQWRDWAGQVFTSFERVEVSRLKPYTDMGDGVASGSGALRSWIDVNQGQVTGVTADVALSQVHVTLGPHLAPLGLVSLTGRLGGKFLDDGFEVFTRNLQFDTQDGLHWPGGNALFTHIAGDERSAPRSEFTGDRLDLDALAQIAKKLPLDPQVHEALRLYAPKGLVERLQASWQGPLEAPTQYQAKGRVARLQVAARASAAQETQAVAGQSPALGSPGIHGAVLDFDFNQSGGHAAVMMHDGKVEIPGLFEQAVIALTDLSGDLRWQLDAQRMSVQLSNLKFSNADAQGELQLKWNTSDTLTSPGHSRFPGVLDLQASMSRAEVARVHNYLPLGIDRSVREYLREALSAGRASGVRFQVKGDLNDFPFADPRQGEFRITADFRDAAFAYLPPGLQSAGSLPWPGLVQLNGEMELDRTSLKFTNVSSRLAQAPGLRISGGEAHITDLLHAATVNVNLQARGPLDEFLSRVLGATPLADMTGQVLSQAHASGNAELALKLQLPLNELEKSAVQGQVSLAGNELQISPDVPRLTRARAVVYFSERGFAIDGGQARVLGGELRAQGGTMELPGMHTAGPPRLRIQGTLTAEGLRQTRELGVIANMAQKASGSTNYSLVFGMDSGVPEFQFSSNLQGLALNLPAPLAKRADAPLPLRVASSLIRETVPDDVDKTGLIQDQLSLELGRIATVKYVRDVSGSQARVLRGNISLGLPDGETVPMPAQGVFAKVSMSSLDLDAWSAILSPEVAVSAPGTPSVRRSGKLAADLPDYRPTSMALQADDLTAGGHKFSHVVAGGTRLGQTWQANVEAQEFSGYLEYRQSSNARAGRVFARLARLSLAQSEARDVESLLEAQPVSIPALDIVVDELELRGKKLGRIEIEAINRGAASRDAGAREWRLNKFNIIMPEAVFSATGNWAVLGTPAPLPTVNRPRAGSPAPERRRTVMNFKLEMSDAGGLLDRLAMKGIFRLGKGKMEGQVAWIGSPLALDYPTLGGTFNINVENGQFLKADPGMAKLLGVLSLQSLPRRLTLDFRDVFSEGFAFDFVRGDVQIEQGMAMTNNLQMKGVNAAVLMEGRADIVKETQDLKVVVVPEINAGTASLIASVINPAVGLGTFLAQLILRRPLIESSTQEFLISGSWAEPKIVHTEAPKQDKGAASP